MSITISEDDFRDQWGARAQDSGDLFEHAQVVNLPLNTVWTVVECDDNNWYALPGFHVVNKLGYVVTDKAWDDETFQAIWFLDDLDHEDEEEGEDEDEDESNGDQAGDGTTSVAQHIGWDHPRYSDWKSAVGNDETVLGLKEWLEHNPVEDDAGND